MKLPRIILMRHGETDWNVQSRLQGQRDIPLNALGREQAHNAGRTLLNLLGPAGLGKPDLHWVSSPLGRTVETIDLARKAAGLPEGGYALDERLKELTFGEWEGLTWPEVRARSPQSANWREGDKWNFVPPGGESYGMLSDRIRPWLQELTQETIVATHGGVARVMLAMVGGMDLQRAALEPIWQGRLLIFDHGKWTWAG
ncbi:MAG: histidine phosphatase family protein [Hyphomicrobiales bacterium]|nr:histidine phosphatase family protein [Hyphomicrobiales bacterium]